jgi:hypothetical protein
LKELASLNGCLSTTRVRLFALINFHANVIDTDDMGFGDQRKLPNESETAAKLTISAGGSPDRIGGSWQLRRISSVVVNGNTANVETLYQRDTHKSIILSAPLRLTLEKGSHNTITVGGLYNGFDYKAADLDKIVVYPPED